ncbi:MAG: helix-turn-helix domain-containing protein [Flavobacteriales bacterium]|nr:helix-turn-helix domain-containing protein [Flavobacteriales bacterium]
MSIFSDNIRLLRIEKSLTQQRLADDLIITRDRLASYEGGRNEPPFEILNRVSRYFKKSIDVLINVDLTKIPYEDLVMLENNRILMPVMVDSDGNDLIEVVPVKASAGYLNGYADPEYIESLQRMKLPFMPVGKHRAFPISGDSMLPVQSGSYVVGRLLEGFQNIKDGRTYILVTGSDGIVYKRVYNKVHEDGTLHLHSDNKIYDPFTVTAEEVLEMWEFVCLINTQEYAAEELNLDSVMGMLRDLKVELAAVKGDK